MSGAVFEIGSTFLFPWAVGTLSEAKHAPFGFDTVGYHGVEQREPLSRSGTNSGEAEDVRGQNDSIAEHGVIRVGYWALGGLLLCLIPAVLSVLLLDARLHVTEPSASDSYQSPATSYPILTIILILFISLSYLFRWTYDLCATQLTQTLIPSTKRSSFGGTEMSIVSLVSLGHWTAAAVWHAQRDFRWLALGSFAVVACGVGAYWWWEGWWRRRGRAESR